MQGLNLSEVNKCLSPYCYPYIRLQSHCYITTKVLFTVMYILMKSILKTRFICVSNYLRKPYILLSFVCLILWDENFILYYTKQISFGSLKLDNIFIFIFLPQDHCRNSNLLLHPSFECLDILCKEKERTAG